MHDYTASCTAVLTEVYRRVAFNDTKATEFLNFPSLSEDIYLHSAEKNIM